MQIIFQCYCGCGMKIFEDGGLFIQSSVIDPAEKIVSIDDAGIVNGKWSVPEPGAGLVEQELGFE